MQTDHPSLYKILNVDKHASIEEIRSAYKKRAFECHPDRHPDKLEEFLQIQNAYEILQNDASRTVYDLYGEQGVIVHKNSPLFRTIFYYAFKLRNWLGFPITEYKRDIYHPLYVTLEELYIGNSIRTFRVHRRVSNDDMFEDVILKIKICKGMKHGQQIIFNGQGDYGGDVIFVIVCKKHNHFTREGDNLIFVHKLMVY